MSDLVKIITSESEFDAVTQSGVVLVDFFTTWCGPCRRQVPILEDVATAVAGKATVIKVDIEQVGALAQRFGVEGIPTLIVFNNGQAVDRFSGLQQAATLQNALLKVAQ